MNKKEIHLDCELGNAAYSIVWNMVSTTDGLSKWFADEVFYENDKLVFKWGKDEIRRARVMEKNNGKRVSWHWEDEENAHTFIRFEIDKSELTRETLLHITDFALLDEVDDQIALWQSQLDALKRITGM